jgi:periplasmic divalent cation tolerance protein
MITAPDASVAERLARTLVEERLAACVNHVRDILSVFRWEGQVRRDAEDLLIVKTTAEALEALEARVAELHPYSVPEVIAMPVVGGHRPYMDWVEEEVD